MQEQRLTAILGPTNTGKTYFALERMLAHESGSMGFPLRLLARENYERAAQVRGRHQVALVTGEDKIIPPGARYFFCTVESMPLDKPVSFLAVDEIQLMADADRGHVFTDRLLYARGMRETMMLGSLSAKKIIQELTPDFEIIERPRFSTLTHSGYKKITRLPPRSAIVTFSIAEIYEIAELIRAQRGGAAIVLGALSPRARNAQVALYEAGEVDYLVATDAIGMGLNLDIHHVAFAHLRKFDGQHYRPLFQAEISQIAGRAGRHLRDGTFGTTAEAGEITPEIAEAVEQHKIEPLTQIYWRHSQLDFRSGPQLLRSLEQRPHSPLLFQQRKGEDHISLSELLNLPDIRRKATGLEATRLLWEVCQIPDFGKLMNDSHLKLLQRLYFQLLNDPLSEDWVRHQIEALNRPHDDIDFLMQRLAHIRTWSFITHRRDWLKNPRELQALAAKIEDDLSDALHHALTQRFIDKRRAILTRQMKEGSSLSGFVNADNEVMIEDHWAGKIQAWQFHPVRTEIHADKKLLTHAARQILRPTIQRKIRQLLSGVEPQPTLNDNLEIFWDQAIIAKLQPGATPLKPEIKIIQGDLLEPAEREVIIAYLHLWLKNELQKRLQPLFLLSEAKLPAKARGLAYRLVEQMGAIDRVAAQPQIDLLDRPARQILRELGVRVGIVTIWLTNLNAEHSRGLTGALYRLFHGEAKSNPAQQQYEQMAFGKRWIGGRAFSFTRLEYIAKSLFATVKRKEALIGPRLAKSLRVPENLLWPLGMALGLRKIKRSEGHYLAFSAKQETVIQENSPSSSPFAILAELPHKHQK